MRGVALKVIQELMGHATLEMTVRYAPGRKVVSAEKPPWACMLGFMASEQFLILGLLGVIVLAAGGGGLLMYRRMVRRQKRQESWRELCLRLELVPQPGNARVGTGELREANFLLHDTGADWLVELPLAQPLLPPGLVLLSPEAPTLLPRTRLRPLEWGAAPMAAEKLAWCIDWKEPPGRLEASQAFLEQALRAVQAHAPLRVESQRLIQALRVGPVLSVSQVRQAVQALHTTASGWREVAELHGLPRVQPLSLAPAVQAPPPPVQAPPPPVQAPPLPVQAPPTFDEWLRVLTQSRRQVLERLRAWRQRQQVERQERPAVPLPPLPLRARAALLGRALPSVLARRGSLPSLGLLNLGVLASLFFTWTRSEAGLNLFMGLFLLASSIFVEAAYHNRGYRAGGLALWGLVLSATLGAPFLWIQSRGGVDSFAAISVRDAVDSSRWDGKYFRFHDGVLRTDRGLGKAGPYPILPSDYRAGEPISVWAVRLPPAPSHADSLGGLAMASYEVPYPLARQSGVRMPSRALFLDMTTHPDELGTGLRRVALALWGGPNALWLVWVLISWRQEYRRMRTLPESKPARPWSTPAPPQSTPAPPQSTPAPPQSTSAPVKQPVQDTPRRGKKGQRRKKRSAS